MRDLAASIRQLVEAKKLVIKVDSLAIHQEPADREKIRKAMRDARVGTKIKNDRGQVMFSKIDDDQWNWHNEANGEVIMQVDTDGVYRAVASTTTSRAERKAAAWPSMMHGSPAKAGEQMTMESVARPVMLMVTMKLNGELRQAATLWPDEGFESWKDVTDSMVSEIERSVIIDLSDVKDMLDRMGDDSFRALLKNPTAKVKRVRADGDSIVLYVELPPVIQSDADVESAMYGVEYELVGKDGVSGDMAKVARTSNTLTYVLYGPNEDRPEPIEVRVDVL